MKNYENDFLKNVPVAEIIEIALSAGEKIMQIYEEEFVVEYKEDKSPLTEADRAAHGVICEGLQRLSGNELTFPILSEEGRSIPYEERSKWETYWCIDPIDGTKEFIKKSGEFTVNIALIHKKEPVLGVVYAPAIGELYYAKKDEGAYKERVNKREKRIERVKLPIKQDRKEFVIVASKSHLNKETKNFIDNLTSNIQHSTFISKGSSLKLLMVAEGSADIYPRLGPTMEWDTAAADAIVRESGKSVYEYVEGGVQGLRCKVQGARCKVQDEGLEPSTQNLKPKTLNPKPTTPNLKPIPYNKPNLLNPWFIVV